MIFDFITSIFLSGSVSKTDGVGILGFRWNPTSRQIIKVHDRGPAKEAGLLPKDTIIFIDENKNTLRPGHPGEEVILTIKRGDRTFKVTLVRKDVRELENKELDQYFGAK